MSAAIQQALARRTELTALRNTVELQKLNIVNAKAGRKPTVSLFAGYAWENSQFIDPTDLGYTLHGWNAGAQMSWNIFDGLLTHGKILQARALYEKSQTDLADQSRQIELQVRTAYSDFIEARELLDSQEKVQEEAEEALREAESRASAGTGTQLDVLDAVSYTHLYFRSLPKSSARRFSKHLRPCRLRADFRRRYTRADGSAPPRPCNAS